MTLTEALDAGRHPSGFAFAVHEGFVKKEYYQAVQGPTGTVQFSLCQRLLSDDFAMAFPMNYPMCLTSGKWEPQPAKVEP